jgi:Protein of unknown function (DUF3309)
VELDHNQGYPGCEPKLQACIARADVVGSTPGSYPGRGQHEWPSPLRGWSRNPKSNVEKPRPQPESLIPACAHRNLVPAASVSVGKLGVELGMSTVLLIILVLLVIGALPTWPYSAGWGYYPSSGLGVVLIVLLVLVLMGRI